jgi:hypothetical protein
MQIMHFWSLRLPELLRYAAQAYQKTCLGQRLGILLHAQPLTETVYPTSRCRPRPVLPGVAPLPSAPLQVPMPKPPWGQGRSPIAFLFLKLMTTRSCHASAAGQVGDRASACMQIFKQLTTPEIALPWEEGRISPQDARKLGKFRKPILKLLQREPSERGTVLQFCKSMRSSAARPEEARYRRTPCPCAGDAALMVTTMIRVLCT